VLQPGCVPSITWQYFIQKQVGIKGKSAVCIIQTPGYGSACEHASIRVSIGGQVQSSVSCMSHRPEAALKLHNMYQDAEQEQWVDSFKKKSTTQHSDNSCAIGG
jgi:hypothetical protein